MSKSSTVISLRVPNEVLAQMPKKDRSTWVLGLIRDNIGLPEKQSLEDRVTKLESQIKNITLSYEENKKTTHVIQKITDTARGEKTTLEQRENLIRECYANGLNYKETTAWLNEQGYLAQRGPFTANSVRSIAKRLGI
jgi:hypothetical protein